MSEFSGPRTLRELLRFVLTQRRLIGIVTVAVTAIFVVVALTKSRTYTATAAFMSQSRRPAGGLSSLAAQFGVAGADVGSESPQFYVDLLNRQSTLRALVDSTYPTGDTRGQRSLVEYFQVTGSSSAIRVDRAVVLLRKRITAAANVKTGVVSISATAEEPVLARVIVERAVAAIAAFNLERRKSQAAAERDFTEQRLAQAQVELRDAENRQEQFLQGNATAVSPRLRLEADRLGRDVAMRQALYTTLAQSFEQARIDAVRDTPVLTMIERPIVPAEPDGRGLTRALILGLFGGLILGALCAYWRVSWIASGP